MAFVALHAVYVFRWAAIQPHLAAITCIVGLYIVEALAALFRYGRITSFHTVLVRIAACTEELALPAVLPHWKADVRGLYWVHRG